MSLPGIGWFTAIRLVLEFGEDLSHFSTGKKIASFVGLTCSEHSTGETERKGRITGMGSGFIRSTLVENSWMAIRKDPVLLAKFMQGMEGTREQEEGDRCRGPGAHRPLAGLSWYRVLPMR